jgi:hypothetical protein
VINLAPIEFARETLYCGRRSGSQVDKFLATGLTPLPAQIVRPPIIQECLAYLECRVKQDIEIGDHNLLVAEVLAAYARPDILTEDDLYDLTRTHPLLHLGRNRFTGTQTQAFEPSLMTLPFRYVSQMPVKRNLFLQCCSRHLSSLNRFTRQKLLQQLHLQRMRSRIGGMKDQYG